MYFIIRRSILQIIIIGNLFADDKIQLEPQNINQKTGNTQLVFVYNAKSGMINAIFDYVHKFVSPQTYSCNLCKITYDNSGKKDQWANYLNSLPINVLFAYKDNIDTSAPKLEYSGEELPCAFLVNEEKTIYLITKNEMNTINDIDELIKTVNQKLEPFI